MKALRAPRQRAATQEATILSRAEPARRARVPVSTLRNWENDSGFPHMAAFLQLAEALGVPAKRLAEGVDEPAGDEAEPGHKELRRPSNGSCGR